MAWSFRAESIEWFIEEQAFSQLYDLAPPPPPPPLSRQQVVSLSHSSRVSLVKLTDGRGGKGGGGAKWKRLFIQYSLVLRVLRIRESKQGKNKICFSFWLAPWNTFWLFVYHISPTASERVSQNPRKQKNHRLLIVIPCHSPIYRSRGASSPTGGGGHVTWSGWGHVGGGFEVANVPPWSPRGTYGPWITHD
jgi:hypothetical protein